MFFTGSLFTLSYVFIFVTQIYAQLELSEELWNENIITAEAVYKSAFIQAIKGNNLDEVIFRQFNMPDTLYVNTTIHYLQVAASKCPSTEDKCNLLRKKVQSYNAYLVDMLKSSNLRNTNAIESTQAFDNYGNHYKGVANDMDPAYMLVAIYPCSRLWNWFENQLKNETDPNTNVYRTWISGNAAGSGGSDLKEFINTYKDFDEKSVHNVFRVSMNMENGIFQEASQKIPSAQRKEEL